MFSQVSLCPQGRVLPSSVTGPVRGGYPLMLLLVLSQVLGGGGGVSPGPVPIPVLSLSEGVPLVL